MYLNFSFSSNFYCLLKKTTWLWLRTSA